VDSWGGVRRGSGQTSRASLPLFSTGDTTGLARTPEHNCLREGRADRSVLVASLTLGLSYQTRMRAIVILLLIVSIPHRELRGQTAPPTVVSRIHREEVDSSAIASIGYSNRLHALEIEFRNGAIYRYLNVPPAMHREIMSASSKARYYDDNIRHRFRSVRVRARLE